MSELAMSSKASEHEDPEPAHSETKNYVNDEKILGYEGSNENIVDGAHTYQHADGRIVEGTLEQARRVCPVIGRMSIEDAQATFDAQTTSDRVAALGRAKREAREKLAETVNELPGTRENKPAQSTTESSPPQHDIKIEILQAEVAGAAKPLHLEPIQTAILHEDETVAPTLPVILPVEHITPPRATTAHDRLRRIMEAVEVPLRYVQKPFVRNETQDLPTTPQIELRRGEDTDRAGQPLFSSSAALPTQEYSSAVANSDAHSQQTPPVSYEVSESAAEEPDLQPESDLPSEPAVEALQVEEDTWLEAQKASAFENNDEVEDTALDYEEIAYSEETLDAYHRIVVIMHEAADTELIQTDDREDIVTGREIPLSVERVQPEVPQRQSFAEYISSQVEIMDEAPPTPPNVRHDTQPLEQTIVEIAAILKRQTESESEPNLVISPEIQKIVHEIAELLPANNAEQIDKPVENIITPELTEKLLQFLRLVGYENPQEVLISFVSRYDIDSLFEAIRYLENLSIEDRRHEFFAVQPRARTQYSTSAQHLTAIERALFDMIAIKLGLKASIAAAV